jgi:hypothetical protein
MTPQEAEGFGLSSAERRSLIRLDSGKVNIAPPSAEAKWYQIIGVPLDNGMPDYPNGDTVQTVEPWYPPDFWRAITAPIANKILDQIAQGFPNGSRYSASSQAGKRGAWKMVQEHLPGLTDKQAKIVIRTWFEKGLISNEPYSDPDSRQTRLGLIVSPHRPG